MGNSANDRPAALITGATGGIGSALCQAFADANYFVIATDLKEASTEGDAYIPLDLSRLPRHAQYQSEFLERLEVALSGRPLRACVNNAAVQLLAPLQDISDDDFQNTLDVNLFAPMILTRLLAPKLEASSGSVVNIGSIHARATKPRFVAYATSKAALRGMTQALAVDLGPRVRVNIIEPAAVATDMLRAGLADEPDAYKRLQDHHPIGRIATPAEVANAALFLASPTSGFLTGSVLELHGGIAVRLHDPE
jgi:NAD(P)-dependent dehydrogenase (short-subunit alcohol dehydrogenase family)